MPQLQSQPGRSQVNTVTLVPAVYSRSIPQFVFEIVVEGQFMLDTPLPAKPTRVLSSALPTEKQIELGQKIAEKYGLTE